MIGFRSHPIPAHAADLLATAHREGHAWGDPAADTIKVLTMHASKGLEFPLVALVGAGHMPAPGEDEREETKLFYVGATRATQRLIIGMGGDGGFGRRLSA